MANAKKRIHRKCGEELTPYIRYVEWEGKKRMGFWGSEPLLAVILFEKLTELVVLRYFCFGDVLRVEQAVKP